MTLQSGTRVGAYEIAGPIGAGGMGEVYLARDSRLHRDVAIKVLPGILGVDADMLARFGREAQVLAQLNHPNIAAVYGVEDAGGTPAIVMELVDGPTLADVIEAAAADGRGLPPLEAVDVARQIAAAMEAAHDQGVIHRDLKPGNIKLRPDGTVKVLDFGLAKAFDPAAPGASSGAFNSPTLSLRATQAGLVLGTAGYMSPEQAKGKAVDRRADIWAFGVVVYEMLCGRQMYTGETVSEILARVIERDPDLSALPAETPRRLRELLRRCLVKDPRSRLRDIGEARIALEEIAAHPSEPALPPAAVGAAQPPVPPAWRRVLPWTFAAASLALAGAVAWAPWRDAPAPLPIRMTSDLAVESRLSSWLPFALSPDGSTLAFTIAGATTADYGQIHVRRLDQLTATPLAGTTGASNPFFSPDGEWIAFFADRKLKKVAVSGGAAVTLCDAPNARGGTWGEDGTIVFAASNRTGLSRVPATGGKPEEFSRLDAERGEVTHRFPQFLPGGEAVLYMSHTSGTNFDGAELTVQRLADGRRHTIYRGGMYPLYLRSGHIAFLHEGTLFAAPFDARSLKTTGAAFPVLERVRTSSAAGFGTIAASATGTLVYVQGSAEDGEVTLQWATRDGRLQPLRQASVNAFTVAVAPDGERVALDVSNGSDLDVWIHEPARDVLTRLTSDAAEERKPLWTPDGTRLTYALAGTKDGKYAIAWRRADGGGEEQRLVESALRVYPASWHRDGKFLAYVEHDSAGRGDIKILSMEGDEAAGWKGGASTVFLATAFQEHEPAFSPDGKWIAYMSNQSGRYDVYVRPFPGPGGQVQVSTDGGVVPVWSRTANELYYLTGENVPMVALYGVSGGTFRPEKPRVWADIRIAPRGGSRPYDLHPDGRRILLLHDGSTQNREPDRLTFLFNAFEEIRRKAPRK